MNLVYLVAIISFLSTTIAQHRQDTLKLAQVVFRHGDRNSDKIFGKYAENPFEFWPEGLETLTNVGKKQVYDLGLFLREIYSQILGDVYSSSEVSMMTSTLDRTIQCAELAMQGLYQKYNNRASWGKDPDNPPFEPIPVKTIPGELDNLLALRRKCPRRTQILDEARGSLDGQYFKDHRDLYEYLMTQSGLADSVYPNSTSLEEHTEFYKLVAVMQSLIGQNKPKEDWMEPVLHNEVFLAYNYFLMREEHARDLEAQRLNAGPLVQLLVETFEKSLNGETDKKLVVFSAHDKTVLNVLWALGMGHLVNNRTPSFASALLLELHQVPGQPDPVIEFWYRNGTTHAFKQFFSPDCGDPCTIHELVGITSKLFNVDYKTECNL